MQTMIVFDGIDVLCVGLLIAAVAVIVLLHNVNRKK